MYAVIFCMTKSYKVIEKNIEKSKVNILKCAKAQIQFYKHISNEKIITTQKILFSDEGQKNKSTGRMPWHWEPKKDATSCEKLR